MTDSTRQTRMPTTTVLAAYYTMLLAFLVASFFPEYRVWGINFWAYCPTYVPLVLFGLGAVIPFAARWLPRREQTSEDNKKYVLLVLGLTLLFGLAFYFLRARTHFLGDGYQILSILASDNPFLKPTEYGEAVVHLWVKSLIGGSGEQAALLSYQIVSITAGVLLLIVVAIAAWRLFEHTVERLLFWLGLVSGGYMLLFFGYVENYSLLVLTVVMYSLMGLLVIKGMLNRWLILIPLAFAIFFHVIAATLIPSAVYLLLANSRAGDFTARQSRVAKIAFTLAALAVAIWVFHHFYTTEYFFRFAFVPLFENRFTVEGYTLFSIKHLADYLNLLLLLLPGLPIVIAVLRSTPIKKTIKLREYRFLLILTVSTLGAVFVLDPKLGMPRDWDLFSFAGVPLAIFGFYYLLDSRLTGRHNVKAAFLAVALSFLSLLPRAGGQSVEGLSIDRLVECMDLDMAKNRVGRAVVITHCEQTGKDEIAANLRQRWRYQLIADQSVIEAARFMAEGNTQQAISMLNGFLLRNPGAPGGWQKLAQCYYGLGEYDSALTFMNTSYGLNPHNATTLYYLGLLNFQARRYQKAEEFYLRSHHIDTLDLKPLLGLAYVYGRLDLRDKYIPVLERICARQDAPAQALQMLGNHYLQQSRFEDAAETYEKALAKGLDSSYVDSLQERYPQLKQYLNLHPIPFDKSP